jgi:diadenosine tetraphosphate (Ap4A) HIT family hydrolase
MNAVNATITRFGYPRTCLGEYAHWVVLLRPQQVTLGALILACREDVTSFARISGAAFAELQRVSQDIETVLAESVGHEKLNYLMLMMVDPHVHFHVLPRYATPRGFDGVEFPDRGWPAVPDLSTAPDLGDDRFAGLVEHFRSQWPS